MATTTKLTPQQIGILAQYIKESIEKYPEPTKEITNKEDIYKQAEWETHLMSLVSRDTNLPIYIDLENSAIFEQLVEYYS